MLYPTHNYHHPFFFHFSSSTTPIFSSLQVKEDYNNEMECVVEGALKSSIRKELSQKLLSPQLCVVDEIWSVNNNNNNNVQNAAFCDDFFVDELLDLSNNDCFLEKSELESHNQQEDNQQQHEELITPHEEADFKQSIDFKTHFESLLSTDLSLPGDDEQASLEWLSHFVEDSNLEYSASFLAGVLSEKPKVEENLVEAALFKTPVPAKARSKRTRTGVRVWPLGSPESSSSSTSSSSSSTTTTTTAATSSPWPICNNGVFNSEPVEFEEPPVKKYKEKPGLGSETPCHGNGNGHPTRRCSHCGVQKTPQWRTGPLGAKTLCNACGVRFKSGRLLPEYRPACSPTFSSELHSNHHRKVMEMRKKKEILSEVQPGLVQSMVSSF